MQKSPAGAGPLGQCFDKFIGTLLLHNLLAIQGPPTDQILLSLPSVHLSLPKTPLGQDMMRLSAPK